MAVKQFVYDMIEKYPVFSNDKEDPTLKSGSEIREIQNSNLRKQIELIAAQHPYYKQIFEKNHIKPGDIRTTDDLVRLPLTYKKDYMQNYEDFRLKPEVKGLWEALFDITYTTGSTTGMPTPFYNTVYDQYTNLLQGIRSSKIVMATPDDVVANLFPVGPIPHIGFMKSMWFPVLLGSPLVSACGGMKFPEFPVTRSLDYAIEMIEKYKCTVTMGIPSFTRRLLMKAQEQGRNYSSLRMMIAVGEPVPKLMRDDMSQRALSMGAKDVFVVTSLGFTECQGNYPECAEMSGSHNPSPDLYFTEVVDEKTGKRLPDGELGLLALTHLNRKGTCLLRYILGDLGAITHEPCAVCGRETDRVIIKIGSTYVTRTKDLVKLKGTLINPELLKDEIAKVKGVLEYQIVYSKVDLNDPFSDDILLIKVAAPDADKEYVEKEVIQKTITAVEIKPKVSFHEPSEIFDPALELKATRIVDLRPKIE
jgi:phenylacetate-coenzyme A ligase PaaK-like adenylate-forming protein